MTNTIQKDEMTNNKLNRLMMLHLLTILALALSACGSENQEVCQSHDDCLLPCEQCKNGTCVLDESRLNACGKCDQPDPEEICGDGLDNDCDGKTDETCEGPCVGVVCDSPPANECLDVNTLRNYSANGTCENGDCAYAHNDIACTHGCSNSFCNEDSCAGIVCDDPPGQCHRNPGTCAGGSCQYDPVTACIDSDGCCPPGCAGQDDDCPEQPSWDGVYGGSALDSASSIQQTSDGGYILAGRTGSSGFGAGSYDAWVLKLDAGGNAAWQKTYGGSDSDSARSVQQTSDGGYILAGSTGSFGAGLTDAWVLKLDASGNVAWQKTYGGLDWDPVHSIQQTSDGGYILAGETYSFGGAGRFDAWVLKLDASGNVVWQKTYVGSGSAHSIQQTTDGGYILAGETMSFGAGRDDAWVLKLYADGNVAWQKTYGGSASDSANSIQQTSDGGYILAGYTGSFGAGSNDAWVLKLDAGGNVAWQKTYGGSGSANSIQQTSDGGYILAGSTGSFGAGSTDAWVLKLDTDGNVAWQKTYSGGFGAESARSVQQTSDGRYVVAGDIESFGMGMSDVWVLKLEADGVILSDCPDDIGVDTSAAAASTSVSPENSTATAETSNATVGDTSIIPQDSPATRMSLCGD